ncbi:MAG: histidinol dehydrogenase [Leptospiraceae bacterium]|nr:histidinol dehydrogenase [Leptospiraceae bacterium]
MAIQKIKISLSEESKWKPFLKKARNDLTEAIETVIPIIKDVEMSGDEGILKYTEKFDGIKLKKFIYNPTEIEENLPESWKDAFLKAKENIQNFHKLQVPEVKEGIISGNRLGFKFTPMDSIAIYAPGGKALYPSSILMGAIPAKIAGVKKISLITPPDKSGGLNPVLAYVAKIAGVDVIYTIGGAQGIAALAYGTETIQKVDFIVGPGNRYVTAAKLFLSSIGQIGIESPAGPSEVFIIADKTANPEWVACDMLSQAEHGEDSIAILATDSEELAEKVSKELDIALEKRPKRKEMKANAIYENSAIFILPNIEECVEFSNIYAPEHLEIITENFNKDFENIKHAGSVFLGPYSPVAMGDYISGTNHVLPTAGLSRIYSSLGVDSFLKRFTYQEIKKESLKELYPFVKTMSEIEGLDEEHGTSVYLRTT